jgi:hypothetical protein
MYLSHTPHEQATQQQTNKQQTNKQTNNHVMSPRLNTLQ